MNDSEIIKAFECCVNTKDCGDCSLVFSNECKNIGKLTLDLIKRQQTEIERLKAERNKLKLDMSYMINPNTIGDRHEMGCW